MFEINVKGIFSASHFLEGYPGDCSKLHGHNWEVCVVIRADKLNDIGLVADFRDTKGVLGEVLKELDHRHLNDHKEFNFCYGNPTTENIARFIYKMMSDKLSALDQQISKVIVSESRDCSAVYWEE